MNKILVICLAVLAISAIAVTAKADKRVCDDWSAAECLYTPSANIHVWYGDSHAICQPAEKFNEVALESKLADGWYHSNSKEGYICKWSE